MSFEGLLHTIYLGTVLSGTSTSGVCAGLLMHFLADADSHSLQRPVVFYCFRFGATVFVS